jgi:hypothetical protein
MTLFVVMGRLLLALSGTAMALFLVMLIAWQTRWICKTFAETFPPQEVQHGERTELRAGKW